ncbi:MAG TPA: hypothetical protein VIG24_10200 [Acidimicrobiia bacterium]
MAANSYKSDLVMGERYRDATTGIQGVLVGVHFFEHACERGTLRYVNKHDEVVEQSFDAPELVHVDTDKKAKADKPGGPARADGGTRPTGRR